MADRFLSVPMTLSDLERRDTKGHFQADLLNNARTVWPRMTKFGRITREEERISRGSATPLLQGSRAQAQPNFGGTFYLCVHPLTHKYQIWRGNTYREVGWLGLNRLVFRWSVTPAQKAPTLPNFGGPFYLCIHALWHWQNYQIWRSNTYGEGACFRGSAKPWPQGQGPSTTHFLVPLYLCIHSSLQNYHI